MEQLGATDADLDKWLRAGIPFSTAPDTRYEYSNYAFGLLGRIVTKAAGQTYEKYVQQQILAKLGMANSTFEFSQVPKSTRAIGYRLKPDGTFEEASNPSPTASSAPWWPAHHRQRSRKYVPSTSPPSPRETTPITAPSAAPPSVK